MMNKSYLAVVLLAASVNHSVFAGTGLNCREYQNMEGDSLGHCVEQTDRELNDTFKTLTKQTHNVHHKPLREAQQAWIKMRDADCKFREATAASYELGVAKDACLVRRTIERIDQLENMITGKR